MVTVFLLAYVTHDSASPSGPGSAWCLSFPCLPAVFAGADEPSGLEGAARDALALSGLVGVTVIVCHDGVMMTLAEFATCNHGGST